MNESRDFLGCFRGRIEGNFKPYELFASDWVQCVKSSPDNMLYKVLVVAWTVEHKVLARFSIIVSIVSSTVFRCLMNNIDLDINLLKINKNIFFSTFSDILLDSMEFLSLPRECCTEILSWLKHELCTLVGIC